MRKSIKIVPATRDICEYVGTHIREEEGMEIAASSFDTPVQAIIRGYLDSTVCKAALTPDGVPFVIWGLKPENWFWTRVWLLGTDDVIKYGVPFLRRTKQALPEILDMYPHIRNWCDARYTVSLRWLKWLGFKVAEPGPYGPMGLPFCLVEKHKEGVTNEWEL